MAIWPWSEGREVSRYRLNGDLDAVEAVEVLDGDHPAFAQPTTGVIVDDDLYYIANSQLQLFSAIHAGEGEGRLEDLRDPVILRLDLAP